MYFEVLRKIKDKVHALPTSPGVYKMLDIPPDLFTPIFTIARIAGWSAHRVEEILTGGKIIRPAYKSNITRHPYININDR